MRAMIVFESNLTTAFSAAKRASEIYASLHAMLKEDQISDEKNYLEFFQTSEQWPSRLLKNGSYKKWGVSKALDPKIEIKESERDFVRAFRAFDQYLVDSRPKTEKEPKEPKQPTSEETEVTDEITEMAANMNQFEVLRQMFMDKGKADDSLKIKKGASIAEIITALEMAFSAE
jgi:intergrase/recombinase